MEFEEHLKIGSGPSEWTEDKVEVKSPNTAKLFSLTGVHWSMDFPKDQF